jgi:hypothetical protein
MKDRKGNNVDLFICNDDYNEPSLRNTKQSLTDNALCQTKNRKHLTKVSTMTNFASLQLLHSVRNGGNSSYYASASQTTNHLPLSIISHTKKERRLLCENRNVNPNTTWIRIAYQREFKSKIKIKIVQIKKSRMKIEYYLVSNLMTADPNDRRAQVSRHETVTEKDIFDYMTRAGSGITLAEAKANYEELIGTFEFFLKQGYGVNTEFIHIRPVMTGVFTDDEDKFDAGRHQIKFRARLGKRYNHTSDNVKVEKIIPPSNLPLLNSLEDIASATMNEMITPGGVASLHGFRLNFKQDDPQQGIFLLDAQKTEFRVDRILSHTGKQIVFQIPTDLHPDEYTMEVRMRTSGSKILKVGKLDERLTM